MRHIIFGTKSQGLSLEIYLHIFQIFRLEGNALSVLDY